MELEEKAKYGMVWCEFSEGLCFIGDYKTVRIDKLSCFSLMLICFLVSCLKGPQGEPGRPGPAVSFLCLGSQS